LELTLKGLVKKMSFDSRQLISDLNFCCIDLETTGGSHEKDKIFEIGLVKIRNLEIAESKEFFINPEVRIPKYVQKLTSVRQADLKDSPLIEDVIDEILEFIGDDILVAHNAAFDVPFFDSVLKRLGRSALSNKSICTNIMTKHMLPSIQKSNLTYLSELFKIDFEDAHRALCDSKITAKIFIKYLEIFIKKDIKKINNLYYPKNRFELDRIHLNVDEKDLIKEKLKLISDSNSNYCLFFKSNQGALQSVVPYNSELFTINELEEMLNQDFERLTIQITSSLTHSLILYKDYYLNIEEEKRLDFFNEIKKKVSPSNDIPQNTYKFIIAPHLVDNHFYIINFKNPSLKAPQIFISPSQIKKSFNFLNKKKRKNQKYNSSLKEIDNLIQAHILHNKQEFLLISSKKVPSNFPEYSKTLQQFLQDQSNTSFPDFHL